MVMGGCWISGGVGRVANIPVVKLSIFPIYAKKPWESLITCSMKG